MCWVRDKEKDVVQLEASIGSNCIGKSRGKMWLSLCMLQNPKDFSNHVWKNESFGSCVEDCLEKVES